MTLAVEPTVGALLSEGARVLKDAGLPAPRRDAEWLLAETLGIDRLRLVLDPERPVPAEIARRFGLQIERRSAHEPLQYILGYEDFRGLRVRTTPGALIPRPETELLVEWALELERAHGPWRLAVDVGAGTGAIACALAAAVPDLRVVAVERSMEALVLAAANVGALGLGRRVRLVAGDLFGPLGGLAGGVDLVVSNPPYIPTGDIKRLPPEVRDWEPLEALDGGSDGMAVHRRLIAEAPQFLKPRGWLLTEMEEGQAEALRDMMEGRRAYDRVEVRSDLRGFPRMIGGRVPGTHAGYPRRRRGCVGAEAWVR